MLRRPAARAEGLIVRDGVRVHYQVFGDGRRAILLLPTWSIVHSDFYRLGTKTVEMPGGMDVKTIGPDNHLRLLVTVA